MKRIFSLFLAVLALAVLFTVCISAEETFVNPVTNGADPFVFKDTDGTYYLYVTSGGAYGYRVFTSTNLVEWDARGYCLRRDDVYTDDAIQNRKWNAEKGEYTTSKIYNFWAPEVYKKGDTYYMVYTAQEHLGIATSDSPLGPFKNDATSYLFPYEMESYDDNYTGDLPNSQKCIDGHFFEASDGTLYLFFVSAGDFYMNGYGISHGNNIWGGPFDLETLTFAEGYPKLLIEHDNNENNKENDPVAEYDNWPGTPEGSHKFDASAVAEGPEMLYHNGKYYLTFSQGSYKDAKYSVFYVTADHPLGPYSEKKLAFITDDPYHKDIENPHLYGTAHHCFTTSPDDSELIIVYHAHRSATPVITEGEIKKATLDIFNSYLTCEHVWERNDGFEHTPKFKCSECKATRTDEYDFTEERRICIDLAGYDDTTGEFWAGRKVKGHPTATEQVLPSGGKLTRTAPVLEGTPFADLVNLPTVYVSYKDGDDAKDGLTANTALKTIEAAYAKLTNGGTIVLTQYYSLPTVFTAPAVDGPIMIKGNMFSTTPLAFRFIRLQSDTYFENLALHPMSSNSTIAAIECNNHNVTIGASVSCYAQPTINRFPYVVGGQWWSGNTSSTFKDFNHYTAISQITSDKEYTITVLGGTWNGVMKGSMKSTTIRNETAPNATLVTGDITILPAKASAPTVEMNGSGAKLTFKSVANAAKYAIYKNGDLVGYSDTTTFVDTSYAPSEEASYTVAGYVHGACIGDASAATAFTWTGDYDGDGDLDVVDAITLLRNLLNGEGTVSLLDVLVVLRALVR